MAKPIIFAFEGNELSFEMNKIDRSKLYGYKELEVLDDEGQPCEMATLADDGRTLVGRGGTGIGYLSADGNWCDREGLQPVDAEGNPITPVKSSFGAPIPLANRITVEQYLNHSIRLIYQLDLSESKDDDALIKELQNGAIFQFDYSYRGGLEWDAGFLLANVAGEVFMLIGDDTSIDYIGLQQATSQSIEDDETQSEDDDLMDFGMI